MTMTLKNRSIPLSPLQERLRQKAQQRSREKRAAMLAPVFAAFASCASRFAYQLDVTQQERLRKTVERLHVSRNLHAQTTPLQAPADRTTPAILRHVATSQQLSGDVRVWFEATLPGETQILEFDQLKLGYFEAGVSETCLALALLIEQYCEVARESLAMVAADDSWMVWIDYNGITLRTLRADDAHNETE